MEQKDSLKMLFDFEKEYDTWNAFDGIDEMKELFYYNRNAENVNIRLLGPHYKAYRLFIPREYNLTKILSEEQFKAFINGDRSFVETVHASLKSKFNNKKKNDCYSKNQVERICDRSKWQACLLVNGLVLPINSVKIITITANAYATLRLNVKNRAGRGNITKVKINGLFAHNIIMSKEDNSRQRNNRRNNRVPTPMGERTNIVVDRDVTTGSIVYGGRSDYGQLGAGDGTYTTDLPADNPVYGTRPPPTNNQNYLLNISQDFDDNRFRKDVIYISPNQQLLDKKHIAQILTDGIIDVPKAIKYNNKKNMKTMGGYFYTITSPFIASSEFMSAIIQESAEIEQNDGLDKVIGDYDRSNLPPEATEDEENINNPVLNMEL